MADAKRFDDYKPVDCNECGRYWDNSCDGVKCKTNSDKDSTGSTRLCNSFLPTRSVVIPAQIKSLETSVGSLRVSLILLSVTMLLHLVSHLLGWCG